MGSIAPVLTVDDEATYAQTAGQHHKPAKQCFIPENIPEP
jgi:hypothetical protein